MQASIIMKKLTKQFLYQEYIINKKSTCQIAKEMECIDETIRQYLIKYKIKIRTRSEAHIKYDKILTKEFLHKEYIVNNKSCHQIAKEVDCGNSTIWSWLNYHNIKKRKSYQFGKCSSNYIDGRTIKTYQCIGCDKEISIQSGFHGKGRCQLCANKLNWQNKKYKEKQIKAMFKGMKLSPNKPEKLLLKLLNKILPKKYKFVGDGKLIVGGFCPDFVNKDNNKIIEIYGDYWHNLLDYRKRDKCRLIAYKKHGYKTLIIWEKKLKNINKIKNKILGFDNE